MTDPDFDFPPEMSEASLTIRDLEFERDEAIENFDELYNIYEDARSLIDGCYEIVEMWKAETPEQVEWKRNWLESARQHGASSF